MLACSFNSIPSGEPGSAAAAALAKRRSVRGVSVRRGTRAVASDGAKLRGVDIRMAAAFALREVGGKMPYKTARHVLPLVLFSLQALGCWQVPSTQKQNPAEAEPFPETFVMLSWRSQERQGNASVSGS
jgi:hypothetical protein